MRRVRFLNGEFDPLTLPQTVDAIFHFVKTGKRGWLCTVNVAILMMMRVDSRLQKFVERASFVVADGQPLVWCAPWLGDTLPERVTGLHLIAAVCERCAREDTVVYLLGASRDVITKATQRLRERYPKLCIECADGYFTKDEAATRADRIRDSGAKILFVGMGVPRQEWFIEEQWGRLGVAMAVGVGGSFDVLSGLRAGAPKWVEKSGLEWLFRLIQEPRRLFMRYLTTNSKFIWLVFSAFVRKKLGT